MEKVESEGAKKGREGLGGVFRLFTFVELLAVRVDAADLENILEDEGVGRGGHGRRGGGGKG